MEKGMAEKSKKETSNGVEGSGITIEDGFTVYEIIHNSVSRYTDARERKLLKVPSGWKVTFSGFNPGSKSYDSTPTLRFYEAETKQRAVFRDVYSFRDMSLDMAVEIMDTESSQSSTTNETGGVDNEAATSKNYGWATSTF